MYLYHRVSLACVNLLFKARSVGNTYMSNTIKMKVTIYLFAYRCPLFMDKEKIRFT